MGKWECRDCGLSRPDLDYAATEIELNGVESINFKAVFGNQETFVEAKLPGLHNVYNALAAFATAQQLDIKPKDASASIYSVNAAFGRTESIKVQDKKLRILLAKNPTGANSNLETLLLHNEKIHLSILLNDQIADGRDVSWIWDVDYEKIFHKIESLHLGGNRAYDLALRFMYGGYDQGQINVNTSTSHLVDSLLADTPSNSEIFILPSYTAMLEFRNELVNRGLTHKFWEEEL